jgi:hypothetical protein
MQTRGVSGDSRMLIPGLKKTTANPRCGQFNVFARLEVYEFMYKKGSSTPNAEAASATRCTYLLEYFVELDTALCYYTASTS